MMDSAGVLLINFTLFRNLNSTAYVISLVK